MRPRFALIATLALAALTACSAPTEGPTAAPKTPETSSPAPSARPGDLDTTPLPSLTPPVKVTNARMRWDHRPQATRWTEASHRALSTHGSALTGIVPRDINAYCPNYANLDTQGRKVFWTGFLSALTKHESTWRPGAVGGGGRWIGLLQITPSTARLYGCNATTVSALKNGSANLACGIRIMARTVKRDGVISAGMRGVAADWGPFHSTRKRGDIQAWTRSQPYCQL